MPASPDNGRNEAETGEQKYNRLAKVLQGIMLPCYPNPNRIDCPDLETVEEIARCITVDIKLTRK